MIDDNGFVDYVDLLVAIGLGCCGFGGQRFRDYGFLVIDIQQVITVLLLQSPHRGFSISLNDVRLGRLELMLRASRVLIEQVVVRPHILHFLLRCYFAQNDALTDIIGVLLEEGLLLLEF